MTITAKIIADSVNPAGSRLTTMQLRYPRFIHSEFMTHRVFSRNASSSRAIPVSKLIEDVENDPAVPLRWGRNQPGMQAHEELSNLEQLSARLHWDSALREAVYHAKRLASLGAHKQVVNRILEPFAHISVVVTSTEWNNFFALRDHPDAQPEMQELARAMRKALSESVPRRLKAGYWHLPYIAPNCGFGASEMQLVKISAARCARVSYLKHDGTPPSAEEELALFDRLAGHNPPHASPLEHQAQANSVPCPELAGNLHPTWHQFRHLYVR